MLRFNFNIEKAISSVKLILKNLDGSSDLHKVFKILYFAEQKHLSLYGRPIIGDKYIAMKHGPVPSTIYDIIKILRGESFFTLPSNMILDEQFRVIDNHVIQLKNDEFDIEVFSETEIECLSEAINENKNLDFVALTEKSHDLAWKNTERDDEMSVYEIAKAAGANSELLKYIALQIENSNVCV